MFPMSVTLTISNAEQLRNLLAFSGDVKIVDAAAPAKSEKRAEPAKKQESVASTEPAATQPTAEASAAPAEKAAPSAEKPAVMTADERSAKVKAAIASSGRDAVVALLQKYGAAKASEVAADKLPAFDAELCKLAA